MAARAFFRRIPHGRALGLRVIEVEPAALTAELPYREEIIGHPWAGFVHSGAITTLIDQACGTAASLAVSPPALVATLDLRLDWLRPATPGRTVRARAECVSIKRHVIFVRCAAYHDDPAEPVALATGTFMRTGRLLRSPFRRAAAQGHDPAPPAGGLVD
ncbi:MAG TPA: PaaI family thioesterase [Gammaproteobacteria bacterium]|nr:PaaI family thioesterase [Gammaproteobacteria bacterium]